MENQKNLALFETEDKRVSLPVAIEDETVWLNTSQMGQLFSTR